MDNLKLKLDVTECPTLKETGYNELMINTAIIWGQIERINRRIQSRLSSSPPSKPPNTEKEEKKGGNMSPINKKGYAERLPSMPAILLFLCQMT